MPIAVKTSSRIGRGACKLALSLLDGTWMKAQQDFFFSPSSARGMVARCGGGGFRCEERILHSSVDIQN